MNHEGFQSGQSISFKYDTDSKGRDIFRIRDTAQPCPGVGLRFTAVINCSLGDERMPLLTMDILNKTTLFPPPASHAAAARGESSTQSGGGSAPPAAAEEQVTPRITCSSGDFLASSQLQLVEETVVAAGLPRECAPSVDAFCRFSAGCASDLFFALVSIVVEADEPGNIVAVDIDEEDDEEEEVRDGAEVEDCSICYMEYVVDGARTIELLCGHMYHRKCLDRWTRTTASCPYCRGPVPVPEDDCFWDDDDDQ